MRNKQLFILLGYLLVSTFTASAQKLDSLLNVLENFTKNRNATKADIAACMNNIGRCYLVLADYTNSLNYYQKALSIYQQLNNKRGVAQTFSNIGTYYMNFPYYNQIEYEVSTKLRAAGNYEKALALFEELADQNAVANELGNLGHIYLLMEDNKKSFMYTNKALNLNKKLGNQKGVADNLWILGDYYFRTFNYSKALICFQKSLNIYNQLGDNYGAAEILLNSAAVYRDAPDTLLGELGVAPATRFIKAIENQKQSLQLLKNIGFLSREVNILLELSKTYEKAGNLDSAFIYYKQFILIRDKALNVEKEKEIERMESKYAYDRKEDSLKLQQQVTDEKLKQQLLLATQQRQEIELRENELALTNKEKDLQKLAYLKTQAYLQNEQLEKQKRDRELKIAQNEKELQKSQVKNLSQQQALGKLKLQQQWIYSIAILVLLALAASYLIYRNRIKEVRLKEELAKEKAEQGKKETEFQRSLADISLTALRSQMNPHFIFNCLNSIKLYTTQNDTAAASEYLTKFSRLIRLVLENSRNERITLASELDALRLYMEMEAMRFKEKLKYNISVDKKVDLDYIEIPPLLLQPYVENAIWHGLMQKDEGGQIDVDVNTLPEESMLVIIVTDDGIGRAKSAELMSKTATKHKSYGMKVTSERLALINRVYKTGANVTIDDLSDNDGKATGTRVTIKIPLE